jgi:hypothetical protein
MEVFRKWLCVCTGKPIELIYDKPTIEDDEVGEPSCLKCGATPSSDPRHTIIFRDEQQWEE